MKKLFLLTFMLFLVSGCHRKVIPVATETLITRTERITDTVTKVVTDSSLLQALLECDSLGRVRIAGLLSENSRLIQQNLSLRDNLLTIQATAQSEERIREVIRNDTIQVYQDVPVPYPEYVNRMTGWQKTLMWIGLLYLVRCGVRIARNWKQITIKTFLKLL